MSKETKWRDRRKNIYTITVATKHGSVAIVETHSNKKKAEGRFARLTSIYVTQKQGNDDYNHYRVQMHTTKLQRKTRWD